MEKLAEAFWKRGINVSTRELRKWLAPFKNPYMGDPERIAEAMESIATKTGKEWSVTVVLNQIHYMFDNEQDAMDFLDRLAKEDAHPLAVMATWRKERVAPSVAILKKGDSPKYIDSTESTVEFFKNCYRYDLGVDIDAITERIKAVAENEKYTDEFFRLVDIDKPMDPEDFVKRVDKALDMIAAAKEQGIELKKVFTEWDRLADEGGERLEKLPAAIKAVAEEAVREKFWKSIEEKLVDAGVKVFDGEVPEGILETAYYLGLADIDGSDVSIDAMERIVENVARVLKNARPIPMYKISEVADVLVKMGLKKVSSAEELEYVSDAIAGLDRMGAKMFIESEVWEPLVDTCIRAYREGNKDPTELTTAINDALREVFLGNIGGKEDLVDYLNKKLFS